MVFIFEGNDFSDSNILYYIKVSALLDVIMIIVFIYYLFKSVLLDVFIIIL